MKEIKMWLRSIYECGVHEGNYEIYEAKALEAIKKYKIKKELTPLEKPIQII